MPKLLKVQTIITDFHRSDTAKEYRLKKEYQYCRPSEYCCSDSKFTRKILRKRELEIQSIITNATNKRMRKKVSKQIIIMKRWRMEGCWFLPYLYIFIITRITHNRIPLLFLLYYPCITYHPIQPPIQPSNHITHHLIQPYNKY